MPDSCSARIMASLCSGVWLIWEMSTIVGRAHVDQAERRHQHPGIGVFRLVGRSQIVLDVAIVVGIEQAVGQDVAHRP